MWSAYLNKGISEKHWNFSLLSNPFEYWFLGLRGTHECTMKFLSSPMRFVIQSNVKFRVYELHLYSPRSPCVCQTRTQTAARNGMSVMNTKARYILFVMWLFWYKYLPASVAYNLARLTCQTENHVLVLGGCYLWTLVMNASPVKCLE